MPLRASSARACRSWPSDTSNAVTRAPAADEPACALGRAAAHLEHVPVDDVAEQVRVGLAQALRAPQQVGVAEERAVLVLVVQRGGVPPGAVGRGALLGARLAVRDRGGRGSGRLQGTR